MSDEELDPELLALEERLRAAHAMLAPRPGLREELRPGPAAAAASRGRYWSGVAAAAAVLLAVGGVGYLLSRPAVTTSSGAGAAAGSRFASGALAFGLLPRPNVGPGLNANGTTEVPSAPKSDQTDLGLPGEAAVYRFDGGDPTFHCPPSPPSPTLGGYPLLGFDCFGNLALTRAMYRLAAPPAGARLVYVAVPDGSVTYFEPAYHLPDGRVVTALTLDELRP